VPFFVRALEQYRGRMPTQLNLLRLSTMRAAVWSGNCEPVNIHCALSQFYEVKLHCESSTVVKSSSKGLGMDTIELRCRAEFCLRLLQLWTDGSLAGRLSHLAARYHEAALRAEFGIPADLDTAAKR